MKQRNEIEKRIEQTLNSLDGIQRAEPLPWLFSRVKGRLMQEEKTVWETIGSFLSKPSVAIAGLCFIIMLNGVLLLNRQQEPPSTIVAGQHEQQQPADSESLIASSSSFDYETLVQP